MLKNYIKIAVRNLIKHKIDSAISIGGLAAGLACCILLVFYVRFEWSYDIFHENKDLVFRITQKSIQPNSGEEFKTLTTSHPLGPAVDSAFPEIESFVNVTKSQVQFRTDDRFVSEVVTFTDPGFFEMFSFPLIYGDKNSVLTLPDGVVLTEQKAMQLFGQKNPIGQTLEVKFNDDLYSYKVTAIAHDLPKNSSIQFEILFPFESYFRGIPLNRIETYKNSWYIGFGETWVMLNKGASKQSLEAKFPAFLKTHLGDFAEVRQMEIGLQSLREVYFDQEYKSSLTESTNIIYSSILAGIALIILAIAGMNYMSLTLSKASLRAHEIGVRKAAGAHRGQVSLQLFGEIFITCSLALALGLMLAEISTPYFQKITGKSIEISNLSDPVIWLALIVMVLLLTLITGSYPAFKIATKNTTLLFSSGRSSERIPVFVKGLISMQFALSIAFLITTFTMNKQLNYLLDKDLGFSSSNVITVEIEGEGKETSKRAELFVNEARRLSEVEEVAKIGGTYRADPRFIQRGMGFGMGNLTSATTLAGFDDGITSEVVDEHYLKVMDLELLNGRNFSPDRPSEIENGIIINEVFAETMGWKNPVGKVISDKTDGNWIPPFDGKEVIGVVKNFHYQPLYEQLRPIALQHIDGAGYDSPGTILVKLAPGSVTQAVAQISSLWNEVIPNVTFNYHFLDDLIEIQYLEEQRWTNIIRFSSLIAISLACFGLFGLAVLSAQQRIKEIGIRKVLGAAMTNIVVLLSWDFIKLVLIGFIIATPIAWYAMNQWLADFAFRIEMGPGIILIAGGTAILIALMTVSWQSVKAAMANPVDSLKSE